MEEGETAYFCFFIDADNHPFMIHAVILLSGFPVTEVRGSVSADSYTNPLSPPEPRLK